MLYVAEGHDVLFLLLFMSQDDTMTYVADVLRAWSCSIRDGYAGMANKYGELKRTCSSQLNRSLSVNISVVCLKKEDSLSLPSCPVPVRS